MSARQGGPSDYAGTGEDPVVSYNFSYLCHWCGEKVTVLDGRSQPHECMIAVRS